MNDHSAVLRRWLDPLDLGTFYSDYWEKKPLFLSRARPDYFSDLLSLEAVDRILTSTNLRVPGFRLVRQGSQIPTREYTTKVFDGLIDVDRVYALYREGATIVLQALERSWRPLIEVCKALEADLGHPVQANMYLTPTNAQGFAAHHDTHDTLILQVEGRKRWKIYNMPFALPLPSQGTLPPGVDYGPVEQEIVLEAGDTLYMPRGVIHEALTSDSYSMHVTVGIKVWTWADALVKLVDRALEACEQEVEFRRSLPLRFAESDEQVLEQALGPLLERFKDHLQAGGVADLLAESFVTSRWAYRPGQLVDLYRQEKLDAKSILCRRGHALARVSTEGERVTLSFQGKWITFPAYALEAVCFVAQQERFRVREIPDVLDEGGKLVLAKRLVREGLLTPVEENCESGDGSLLTE
jgi:ribosomal protein L16 Arg81 hydroxylase